jgi:hypothetical protein
MCSGACTAGTGAAISVKTSAVEFAFVVLSRELEVKTLIMHRTSHWAFLHLLIILDSSACSS